MEERLRFVLRLKDGESGVACGFLDRSQMDKFGQASVMVRREVGSYLALAYFGSMTLSPFI